MSNFYETISLIQITNRANSLTRLLKKTECNLKLNDIRCSLYSESATHRICLLDNY